MKKPIIGIIGIEGAFGKWLKNFFEKRNFKVIGSDKNTETKNTEVVMNADVVIFSILPISIAIKEMEKMADYSRRDQLWMDVTSVKIEPVKAMFGSKASVVGLHPMCRPSRETLKGQKLIACFARTTKKWRGWINWFLEETEADICLVSTELHDSVMSIIQNLFHAAIIALAMTIRDSGKSISNLNRYTSPFYRIAMSLVGRILNQNPTLYFDIQTENPYGLDILKMFRDNLEKLIEIIEDKDRHDFEIEFILCRNYMGKENTEKASDFFSEIIKYEIENPHE